MNKKKNFIMVILLLAGVSFLFSSLIQQETARELFERALYHEETKGELEKAIEVYSRIVKEFPDERATAAKALLHIGLCYEKLGNKEAQKAYQRLIEEYPGQRQEVSLARERLATLAGIAEQVSRKPTFRKIQTPFKIPVWSGAQLSPDGKTLAFGSGSAIWTVPIPGRVDPNLAGEPRELEGAADVLGVGLSWSGDGRWIAFSRVYKRGEKTRILFRPEGAHIDIIPSAGGVAKRIQIPQWVATKGATFRRLSLSPDGRTVAFDAGGQIYSASVDSGDIKQLTKNGGISPCFSPDGTKIAYLTPPVRQDNPPARLHEVWVISAAGEDPVKISDDVNENLSAMGPIWSPDGKMIAFWRFDISRPIRAVVCIVPVSEEGKPLDSPLQIELPLITHRGLTGWTPDNKIGLLLETPYYEHVYTVPASGGKASQVSPLEGLAGIPRWSPDGKRIFFRWKGGGLGSVPSDGGEVRAHSGLDNFRDETGFFTNYPSAGNSVSPDGKLVVFSGGTATVGPNIYTIPVEGGKPEQITSGGAFPCWSPDGKWIAYLALETVSPEKRIPAIFMIPREGGEAQKITSQSDNVTGGAIDWSPDGKSIAYFSKKEGASEGSLNLVPVDGGEAREICPVQDVSGHSDVSWSPDGQKIAFVSKSKIWVVPADGGEPVEVKTDVDAWISKLDWSPDGRKIAFSGDGGMENEFWFMEDFLHLVKK